MGRRGVRPSQIAGWRTKEGQSAQHAARWPDPDPDRPAWQPGSPVRWRGRAGTYRRDVGDGEHAEIVIGERVYRVQVHELG
jgi:hypothetical protein